jgi:hypothetical protein
LFDSPGGGLAAPGKSSGCPQAQPSVTRMRTQVTRTPAKQPIVRPSISCFCLLKFHRKFIIYPLILTLENWEMIKQVQNNKDRPGARYLPSELVYGGWSGRPQALTRATESGCHGTQAPRTKQFLIFRVEKRTLDLCSAASLCSFYSHLSPCLESHNGVYHVLLCDSG